MLSFKVKENIVFLFKKGSILEVVSYFLGILKGKVMW